MSDKGLETNEEYMLQIGDTLISLDVIERDFICNLSACRGACCIEGDAGAPITEEERLVLMKLLPEVWNDLTPAAREIIKSQGVAYVDEGGGLVTFVSLPVMVRMACVCARLKKRIVRVVYRFINLCRATFIRYV